ncbi:hypothetical protein [Streptomyces chromofuscus]|uniref:Uncharacterized protein n=1 Tax=Streptomyces chromofuscus TaxID=42881 RepID=A0A7M2T0W0_STRCW|nr:hypothetical protein [Streptomyces chromofuscus]QOV42290.1 hypothetical protein IPT68_20855 [Streptomyces chromofuscus]GGT34313.1 hypothetical protein GCM10010254_63470 [Streptomyces chromofuscus]
MSGQNFYFGDNVNMHGGTGHTGFVKGQVAAANVTGAAASTDLQAAVQHLLQVVEELRDRLPAAEGEVLDDYLPAITADTATVPPQARHRALYAVAGIAATVGALGQPVVEAVNKVLELLAA